MRFTVGGPGDREAMNWLASGSALLVLAAGILAGLRWLRVAQLEHYLPGRASLFAWRWWSGPASNQRLSAALILLVAASVIVPLLGVLVAIAVLVGPRGLGLKSTAQSMVWSARARLLGSVYVVLMLFLVLDWFLAIDQAGPLGAALAVPLAGVIAILAPVAVDVACAVTEPIERRRLEPFVTSARARLASVSPRVVAITGSFGKTSTKAHLAAILKGERQVVASPRSFNNRAGLARAVNESLPDGTEIFIAEMGTYGPGEIADLCSWLRPEIAAITAIGPVHLERFGSEDAILAAKSEILEGVSVGILNVDDPRLAALARRRLAEGKPTWIVGTAGSDADDSSVGRRVLMSAGPDGTWLVTLGVETLSTPVSTDLAATNVAVAVAFASELGLTTGQIDKGLAELSAPESRLVVAESESGVVVLDDTYNSNPAGFRRALDVLARRAGAESRRVVVTPGMVELGHLQAAANRELAARVAEVASDLVIVGHTNSKYLTEGVSEARPDSGSGVSPTNVVHVPNRSAAVAWVRDNLHRGDVVLYENDLPAHYP